MATILVIDDDELVSRTLQRALKLYGYQVMVANSGAEGLQIARRHRPDLFILDIMMPGADGYQVCRQKQKVWRNKCNIQQLHHPNDRWPDTT